MIDCGTNKFCVIQRAQYKINGKCPLRQLHGNNITKSTATFFRWSFSLKIESKIIICLHIVIRNVLSHSKLNSSVKVNNNSDEISQAIQARGFFHFSAFNSEYVKAPAAITSEEMNRPIIASNFVHLVAIFPVLLM